MKNLKLIIDFIEYVSEFYNDRDGIYPIATHGQIKDACILFVDNANKNNCQLHFDSLDRESVRTILEPTHSIFIP